MNRRLATIFTLALSWSLCAHAEPLERGALRLDWTAPGGCPNGAEVLERIEALLGTRIADLRPAPITARGRVRQIEPLRYELELETEERGERFVRTMQAPSCAELSDAGALVLALAIDPTLAERRARAAEGKPAETSALPSEPAPLAPAVVLKAAPAPKAAPTKPVQTLDSGTEPDELLPPPESEPSNAPVWSARLGLVLDFGSVADMGLGPRASAAGEIGRFRAEVGLLVLPPTRTFIAGNPDRGGDIDLIATDLVACALLLRGTGEAAGCADVEIGRIHGQGFGTATVSEGSEAWFAAGASGVVSFEAAESLSVVASAGVLFVPQDTEFTLENVGLVHRVPSAVLRFGLGVETEFP